MKSYDEWIVETQFLVEDETDIVKQGVQMIQRTNPQLYQQVMGILNGPNSSQFYDAIAQGMKRMNRSDPTDVQFFAKKAAADPKFTQAPTKAAPQDAAPQQTGQNYGGRKDVQAALQGDASFTGVDPTTGQTETPAQAFARMRQQAQGLGGQAAVKQKQVQAPQISQAFYNANKNNPNAGGGAMQAAGFTWTPTSGGKGFWMRPPGFQFSG